MKYVSPPRYQKNNNVFGKRVTDEYKPLLHIFRAIPKDSRVLDIACAEGFVCYLARLAGIRSVAGVEIGRKKVEIGKKEFKGVRFVQGNAFERPDLIRWADVIVVSRFFHNVGWQWSCRLMDEINRKSEYLLIVKHKQGPRKENGEKREELATRAGVKKLLGEYGLAKKTFPKQIVVAAKGDNYKSVLHKLSSVLGVG